MQKRMVRVLSAADVAQALSMEDAVAAMEEAFAALYEATAAVPQRVNMALPADPGGGEGELLLMPAAQRGGACLSLKLVTIKPENPARGLPLIHGLLVVLDAQTGAPRALMDAEHLTALRTGAASGLATRLLARPDADTVALFGTGAQAHTQLAGVAAVRRPRRILVVGRDAIRTAAFCDAVGKRFGPRPEPATAAHAAARADIICTATTSCTPLFDAAAPRPGTHINAVGGYRADMRELPRALMGAARVVVDHPPACLTEAGEVVDAVAAGVLDPAGLTALGALVTGAAAGRGGADEITVFKSVGNAAQDLAAAARVLARAEALNLGVMAPL